MRFSPYFLLVFHLFVFSLDKSDAQWLKTNGVQGGGVVRFMHHGDTLLAQVGGHIYYSSNNGLAWTIVPGSGDISLTYGCSDGQTIVGVQHDFYTNWRFRYTVDFGQHWEMLPLPPGIFFRQLFFDNGYLYGVGHQSIHRSNDFGQQWELVYDKQIENIQHDGLRLTGTRYQNVLQSTDGGFTWDTIHQYAGNAVGLLQANNHLFLFFGNAQGGCHVSQDNGQTWQQYLGTSFHSTNDYTLQNGVLYVLQGHKMLKSPDLGQTWSSTLLPNQPFRSVMAGTKDGSALLLGDEYNATNGLLRSLDGGVSWSPIFGFAAIAGRLREFDDELFVAGYGGLNRLNSDGVNWDQLVETIPVGLINHRNFTNFWVSNDNWLLTTSSLFFSNNYGMSWESSDVHISFVAYPVKFGHAAGKLLMSGSDGHWPALYTSYNDGEKFFRSITLHQQHQVGYPQLYDIDNGLVYALGPLTQKFYRSDDGGELWNVISDGLPIDAFGTSLESVRDLHVRGTLGIITPNQITNRILLSKDQGLTWQVKENLPFDARFISDLIQVGNIHIVATNDGVFVTEDLGETWQAWNNGLTSLPTDNIVHHDGFVWAATAGNGVWRRPITELGLFPAEGIVFQDLNANGQQDPGEQPFPNIIVESVQTISYTSSQTNGTFSLLSSLPVEEIKANPPKPYWFAIPATQTVAVPSSGTQLALALPPNAQDLWIDLTNVAVLRPGFSTDYVLSWRNIIPKDKSDVSITLHYPDSLIQLLAANPAPTFQTSTSLTWDLGTVPANGSGSIDIRFYVPDIVLIGTEVCTEAVIDPVADDILPDDNRSQPCVTVVGAYDPNDKQAEPESYLSLDQVAANAPVHYTVRFQNTGNYPATFVRILDTLDQNFNPGSFEFIASSHPCTWQMRGQGVIEFFFDNIQLPAEEFDEPGSHGFVRYSVRPRVNTLIGTILRNTAHIFFDFNEAIITNTTETSMGLVRVKERPRPFSALRLSPNPAHNQVRVSNETSGELSLYDATGKLVMRQYLGVPNGVFSVTQIPAGVYQVSFSGSDGVKHRAVLVVQR